MEFESRGPGPPSPRLRLIVAVWLACVVLPVLSDTNKLYEMKTLCKTQFMHSIYQQIDGAVITSKNERNLDCVVTFQTLSILQRFMLRFERLRIDCNDHLYIYEVANAVGPYKADLTCTNTSDSVGVMVTSSNYITLRYVTDAWGVEIYGFELLITAFKNQSIQSCFDFRCSYTNHCISKDLICDGLNHCLDGSDETLLCSNKNSVLFGMNLPTMVVVVVSIGLLLLILCVAFLICRCSGRKQQTPGHVPPNSHNSTLNYRGENYHAANGTSFGINDTNFMHYNQMGNKVPGNWRHPAGLKLGYSVVRVRLNCQAK